MIFDLVKDFTDVLIAMPEGHPRRRILKLFDEAIRRDVHFIDRHPTTFFQCLWNTCWWYDCPDVERFGSTGSAGGHRRRQNLHVHMEKWRIRKSDTTPTFTWLRSLLPPQDRLGTGLVASLVGHDMEVNCVAFSADGSRIATGSADRTARIWDSATGEELSVLRGDESAVCCVAFSPDGQVLLSGSENGVIDVWDVSAHRRTSITAHSSPVDHLCFSADGSIFASAGSQVRVWHTMSCKKVAESDGHSGGVGAIRPHNDGFEFASVSGQRGPHTHFSSHCRGLSLEEIVAPDVVDRADSIDVHRLSTTNPILDRQKVSLSKQQRVTAVSMSRNGLHLAAGLEDTSVQVWSLKSKSTVLTRRHHQHPVSHLAFSSDGSLISVSYFDNAVHVWRVDSGEQVAVLPGRALGVVAACFSSTGSQIACGGADCIVRVWEISPSIEQQDAYTFETSRTIRVSHGGNVIPASSEDWSSPDAWIEVSANRRSLHCPGAVGKHKRRFEVTPHIESHHTTITDLDAANLVAWLPGCMFYPTFDNTGECWAGTIDSVKCVFRIESIVDQSALHTDHE